MIQSGCCILERHSITRGYIIDVFCVWVAAIRLSLRSRHLLLAKNSILQARSYYHLSEFAKAAALLEMVPVVFIRFVLPLGWSAALCCSAEAPGRHLFATRKEGSRQKHLYVQLSQRQEIAERAKGAPQARDL